MRSKRAEQVQTLLFEEKQREDSGGRSWNRHEYHHAWALVHLLTLHEMGRDYLVALEFHDDVLVLEPSVSPKSVNLYQIKTRPDGKWSDTLLLKPGDQRQMSNRKGKRCEEPVDTASTPLPKSILGKLVAHLRWCSRQVGALTLVSDAPFDLQGQKARTKALTSFCATALHPDTQRKIRSALKDELLLPEDPPLEKLHFERAPFGVRNYQEYAISTLQKYMERRFKGRGFRSGALHSILKLELEQGLRAESTPSTFELLQVFGLNRAKVDDIILTSLQDDPSHWLSAVLARLDVEHVGVKLRGQLEVNWHRYMAEKVDESNVIFQAFSERVRDAVRCVYERDEDYHSLTDLIDATIAHYRLRHGGIELPATVPLLKGAILYEYKSYEARQSSAVAAQREKGAT